MNIITKGSPLKNRFVKNSFAYIMAAFIIKGISFLTTPLFTRIMGASDYGAATNFLTWGQLLAVFICFLVSSSVVSANVNIARGRLEEYLYNLTKFSLFSFAAFSVIILSVSCITRDAVRTVPVFPVLVYAFGSGMSELFSAYCIAADKVRTKVCFAIGTSVLFVVSGITFVLLSENKSDGRIWGYFISYALISVFVICYFLRITGQRNRRYREDLRYALTFSIPLIPHILANLVNGRIDILLIMRYAGGKQAGIYSVAYSIGAIALTFASAATDAWTPWYYDQTRGKNNRVIAAYYKAYTLTIGMCFFGVMMLGGEIMRIMAPEEYAGGTSCIPYVAVGIYFLFMYRFPLCYEQLLGNTKYVAPATILAAAMNILLNSVWIPDYGIKGAALATAVSYGLLWFFHEIVARFVVKNYNIHFADSLVSAAVVIIAFMLTVFAAPGRLIRYTIVFIVCVLYVVYIGCLTKNNK